MDANRCLDDLDPDFEYKHANDSHSWLMDYPETLKPGPNTLKTSWNNETYTKHEFRRQGTKGRKKMLMESFYRQLLSEELLKQLGEENITVEEYITDYMEKFKNPDDMPLPGEMLSKNEKLKKENVPKTSNKPDLEELKSKYPLYLSAPLTYFSQKTGRSHFRKNTTITKSPDQNYDNVEY